MMNKSAQNSGMDSYREKNPYLLICSMDNSSQEYNAPTATRYQYLSTLSTCFQFRSLQPKKWSYLWNTSPSTWLSSHSSFKWVWVIS